MDVAKWTCHTVAPSDCRQPGPRRRMGPGKPAVVLGTRFPSIWGPCTGSGGPPPPAARGHARARTPGPGTAPPQAPWSGRPSRSSAGMGAPVPPGEGGPHTPRPWPVPPMRGVGPPTLPQVPPATVPAPCTVPTHLQGCLTRGGSHSPMPSHHGASPSPCTCTSTGYLRCPCTWCTGPAPVTRYTHHVCTHFEVHTRTCHPHPHPRSPGRPDVASACTGPTLRYRGFPLCHGGPQAGHPHPGPCPALPDYVGAACE